MRLRFTLFHLYIIFILGILLGSGFMLLLQAQQPVDSASSITPIFSPEGKPEFISAIRSASTSLELEVYVFSYRELADELISAHERGVKVRVLLEPTLYGNNPNLQTAEYLREGGVEVRWATPSRTNHAKYLIIDGRLVLMGSHNWSWHAMNENREASVLVQDEGMVREFGQVFEEDLAAAYT